MSPQQTGTLSVPSSSAAPASPYPGQLWFDAATGRVYYYDGADWNSMSGAEHEITSGLIEPEEIGFKAYTFDPLLATLNAALPAGQVVFARVPVRKTITIANLHVYVDVIGATLTSGQNLGLVYSKAGVLLGRTASQHTTSGAQGWITTGEKVMPVTAEAGQSLTITGGPTQYVIAAAYSVGTTRPSFSRWDAARSMALANKGLAGNALRWGVANSGLTSTPPANLGSQASSSNYYWFGLS